MALHLPKDSFIALAAVAWADGTLGDDEARALLRVARETGLSEADVAEIERATATPIGLDQLKTTALSRGDRVIVYALASWLAHIDDVVTDEERASLAALGGLLGLPEGIRRRAAAAAAEVAALPAGNRPERYDFSALRARILAKLGNVEVELAQRHGLDPLCLPRSRPSA